MHIIAYISKSACINSWARFTLVQLWYKMRTSKLYGTKTNEDGMRLIENLSQNGLKCYETKLLKTLLQKLASTNSVQFKTYFSYEFRYYELVVYYGISIHL